MDATEHVSAGTSPASAITLREPKQTTQIKLEQKALDQARWSMRGGQVLNSMWVKDKLNVFKIGVAASALQLVREP